MLFIARIGAACDAVTTVLWTVRNSAVRDFGCLLQTLDNTSNCLTTSVIRFPYIALKILFLFLVSGEFGVYQFHSKVKKVILIHITNFVT
jgi:hypothetical protein